MGVTVGRRLPVPQPVGAFSVRASPSRPARGYGRAMTRHVALLRGINVGGRNRVAMADLRAAFTAAGYGDVSTYIASGNVLFTADADMDERLEKHLEAMLRARLGMPLMVVTRTREQMRRVVQEAPAELGASPGSYLCDAMFLRPPVTAEAVTQALTPRDGVDTIWPGDGVVYFRRLAARRAQSRLSAITTSPLYRQMTIRSWATTTRLADMLDEPVD